MLSFNTVLRFLGKHTVKPDQGFRKFVKVFQKLPSSWQILCEIAFLPYFISIPDICQSTFKLFCNWFNFGSKNKCLVHNKVQYETFKCSIVQKELIMLNWTIYKLFFCLSILFICNSLPECVSISTKQFWGTVRNNQYSKPLSYSCNWHQSWNIRYRNCAFGNSNVQLFYFRI